MNACNYLIVIVKVERSSAERAENRQRNPLYMTVLSRVTGNGYGHFRTGIIGIKYCIQKHIVT